MRLPARPLHAAGAGIVLVAVAVAGCTSEVPAQTEAGGSSVSARPAPTGSPKRPANGLTGTPGGIGRPQLAVKVDNTRAAHPQVGVGDADVVYVEQVEGELTRLLAIFSSRIPAEIGPVRSARESDLDLLRQYGRVDFAFSGANRGVLKKIAKAPVNDVSEPSVPAAFSRGRGRRQPYNLFLHPQRALAAKPAAVSSDIGLQFSAAPPAAGAPSAGFSVRFGPSATVAARYDRPRRAWQIVMDGRRRPTAGGSPVAPANVIVQYMQVRGSRFHDVLGHVSPYTVSTGAGKAVVFRDGRALPARWSRPKVTDGTRFVASDGVEVALRPGQTWILLVPAGIPLGAPPP